MDKLLLIIKREFLAKVKNKSFIIITILSPVIMVALLAFIIFIQSSSRNEFKTVSYIDSGNIFEEVFKDSEHIKYINLKELELEKAKLFTKESDYYCLVHVPDINNIEELEKKISIYAENTVGMSFLTSLESKFAKVITNKKLTKLNIDLEKIKKSDTNVNIKTIKFSGEQSSKIGSMLKMAFGGGMGYLIFMFIIIYGNSVMRSVIEEKSNRIIEVIISSVKPFYLMLGKIFGNALAGLLQFAIWIVSALILISVLSSVFGVDSSIVNTTNISPDLQNKMQNSMGEVNNVIAEIWNLPLLAMLISFIFYFLGGYLVYSSIYAAIGAAVENETDTQQFMIPVMTPLIVAIYAGFSIIESPHSTISVGFSIFPLTSPIVMLMRIPFGVPTWQIILSIVLLILTFFVIVFIAAKIYRVGVLMYGKKPSYKELYKWLRL